MAPQTSFDSSPCHVCGGAAVTSVSEYPALARVTSDCKPWPKGGKLVVCSSCGCAQAVLDAGWHVEAQRIYESYEIYHTGHGAEQNVFDAESGAAASRSARLLQRVVAEIPVPERGRLLDVGCGNGALLRAFAKVRPGWRLSGVEVNDHYSADLEAIPGFERLHVGRVASASERFDLVSLMHALEHIPGPRDFLASMWDLLEPGGLLLIQVPDCEANPFMFLVADHATHFFLPVLREVVAGAGYDLVAAANTWVTKELTVVARKPGERREARPMTRRGDSLRIVEERVSWLATEAGHVERLAAGGRFGLFGTSIAATWLYGLLPKKPGFFVDEDPNRVGGNHLGLPVFAPAQVPAGSHVYLALPPFLAKAVAGRLAGLPVQWHAPAGEPQSTERAA